MPVYMLIVWLLIGVIVGYLIGVVQGGSRPFGLLGDLVFGIVGALLGGWSVGLMKVSGGGIAFSIIASVILAAVLVWLLRLFKRQGTNQ